MAEPKSTRPPRRSSSHQRSNLPHGVEVTPPPPWETLKTLLPTNPQQANRGKKKQKQNQTQSKKHKHGRMRCSVSICSTRGSSEVIQRPEAFSPKHHIHGSSRKTPLKEINGTQPSSTSPSLGSQYFKGVQFRRFSGCYEHHSVVDPSLRSAACSCPDCGQMFTKPESLELHQAVRHAVTELGTEDTSRNIVEIIFQSSWLKKPAEPCKIDRILKINNTQKTISRFEGYREQIKARGRKYPRCVADGNELLRFYSAAFTCNIGLEGCTGLCHSFPPCKACSIIRDGFKADAGGGIRTMATSGSAHAAARVSSGEKRAMLVCRVVAGRIRRTHECSNEEHDSVAGPSPSSSNLDELFVPSARAILPCFLVIYREV